MGNGRTRVGPGKTPTNTTVLFWLVVGVDNITLNHPGNHGDRNNTTQRFKQASAVMAEGTT